MPFVVMIAGPNGSGKTTLTRHIRAAGQDLGFYINSDDIAAELSGAYDSRVGAAQAEANWLRDRCLQDGTSFSFETVMSHPSKIDFLRKARDQGFTIVLYFVSTSHPNINLARVAQRVAMGGHDVLAGRIVSRYHRTMALLPAAIVAADASFLFDNSQIADGRGNFGLRLVAEIARTGAPDSRAYAWTVFPPLPGWVMAAENKIALSPPGKG